MMDALELEFDLKVRISTDAFPGSDDEDDIRSRGQIGEVVGWDEFPGSLLVYVKVPGMENDRACLLEELSTYTGTD